MITVPTIIRPSIIHGVGMFTLVDVEAGHELWKYVPGFDRSYTESEFDALPALAQQFVSRHGFLAASGLWIISGDNDQFVNHSSVCNMVEPAGPPVHPTKSLVAARDIKAGEELTQDYLEWDQLITTKQLP